MDEWMNGWGCFAFGRWMLWGRDRGKERGDGCLSMWVWDGGQNVSCDVIGKGSCWLGETGWSRSCFSSSFEFDISAAPGRN
jgi:hypothetical protein